ERKRLPSGFGNIEFFGFSDEDAVGRSSHGSVGLAKNWSRLDGCARIFLTAGAWRRHHRNNRSHAENRQQNANAHNWTSSCRIGCEFPNLECAEVEFWRL